MKEHVLNTNSVRSGKVFFFLKEERQANERECTKNKNKI